MPKMKTNRGAAKRFKVAGSGRLKRAHCMRSHILTKKSTKRKRKLRQGSEIDRADRRHVRRMLGL